jgi:hypothetical protein
MLIKTFQCVAKVRPGGGFGAICEDFAISEFYRSKNASAIIPLGSLTIMWNSTAGSARPHAN